ncbi:hypothetical protein DFP72DRAFT_1057937 [Ephemerocybe angulata]|uniref:DUF6589 domain-containing protein n=1 Tax=Ephemerocybe angulata TaxID=980116 RepID=A0A8H6IK12_9AGAR|nr:hypothetical protein DFP72DRAFT_1057937 [Tulosesus angulatus]
MSRKPQLAYQPSMWTEKLGDMPDSLTPDQKNHLLSSLLIHLDIRLADLLPFIFETRIEDIRRRAGSFMGYWQARGDSPARFPPAVLYTAWHQNFPKSRDHLHEMITPCAKEIALKESDRIINAKELKIRTKNVTSDTFSTVFTPGRLREFYQTNSPFIWGILETFAASPNRYRKRVERKKAAENWEDVMDQDERDDDPDFDEDDPAAVRSQGAPELPGFSRDPDMAILISISAMTFARNRATNLLPTICGVFFKIEGTSSRVVRMLSNIGLSVSSKMVERIKENISDDAIRRARTLMKSGRPFVTVFDNLNFYLWKHQQQITNQNESLNVTNSAILGIPDEGIDVKKALNLDEHLKRRGQGWADQPTLGRGQRKNARFQSDILPTPADGEYLQKAFKFIIAEFIVRYTPGSDKWEGRAAMLSILWKYEISPELKKLLSRAWFVNRWGKEGCWIAADLYLEQLNLLVKRVFIAQGSGVTADYIIKKGSACVETFRQVSYLVSRYFGNPDRRRKSKELSFKEDLRVLVEDMERHQLHK